MIPEGTRPLGFAATDDNARPVVLFLHGFMGSMSEWAGVVEELASEARCVAVDLPGHGSSLRLPEAAYTIEGAAGAVLGALDGLEIPHATLVGYSMGGRLALYLALHYPERCSGLFLESASPGIEDAAGRRARREADEERARRLESGKLGEFLRDWYGQPLFAPLARDGALLRRVIAARRKNDPAELAKSLRGMGTGSQPSLWKELADLRVPVLAVAGGLDEKFVGISRRMEREGRLVQAAIVPDTGHDAHHESPGAYLTLLRQYLDRSPGAPAG